LRQLQRGWGEARSRTRGRRSNSRAAQAVDLLAAAPLLSATTLAKVLGMSVKCAGELLERFVAEGIVIEVTHRSARRLFGLAGLAPLREAVQPRQRPDPDRRRGRPRQELVDLPADAEIALPPSRAQLDRPVFDYADLEAAMSQLDLVIKDTRRKLQTILQ
jgi:hypothetical protein